MDDKLKSEISVKKRNGRLEVFDAEKVNKVANRACLNLEDVFPSELVLDAKIKLFDKISTESIDFALIDAATAKIPKDPNWSYVAARLLLNCLYKEIFKESVTDETFTNDYRSAFIKGIKKGIKEGFFDERLADFDLKKISAAIDPIRDELYTSLGVKNLKQKYLFRVNGKIFETPQAFWMRVAMGLSLNETNKEDHAINLYNTYSNLLASASTPTLFNSGTLHSQTASCFGSTISDDANSIWYMLGQNSRMSKYAGGLGIDVTALRASGSHIKSTNGTSSGPIPFIKMIESMVKAFNQGGKRAGSACVYMEPWHMDFQRFMELRKPTGDEWERTHKLNTASWYPDEFFNRLKKKQDWYFFDPKDVSDLHEIYGKEFDERYCHYVELADKGELNHEKIKAIDLWSKHMRMLFETSHPWITFKDAGNMRYSNIHEGVVHNSQLCVAPETLLLTKDGHKTISSIVSESVEVWNGKQWSETTVLKTGENQKLLTVILSDGKSLTCTPYHKWYVCSSRNDQKQGKISEKRTHELVVGDCLMKFTTPILVGDESENFTDPYTHGFFCGDGTYSNGRPCVALYGEKKDLLPYINVRSSSFEPTKDDKLNVLLPLDINRKFDVPVDATIVNKISWLEGFLDADGTISRNGDIESIQAASIELEFLKNIQLMLQTIGITSKVTRMREAEIHSLPDGKGGHKDYSCKPLYRLLINSTNLYQLHLLGFSPKRLKFTPRVSIKESLQYVRVVDIKDDGRFDDTYCVSEPLEHKAVFNGILTGNCTEIFLHNKPTTLTELGDVIEHGETYVCQLSSVNLKYHISDKTVDWDKLKATVKTLVRAIDNAIDINFYPTHETKAHLKHRPIALGIMGFQDLCYGLGIQYDSDEGVELAGTVQEFISYHSILTSSELAKERGAYQTYVGSLWSKNIFPQDTYIDLMEYRGTPTPSAKKLETLDWGIVRDHVKQYGMRNSNTQAIAPTAGISYIHNCEQSIEPTFETLAVYENDAGTNYNINAFQWLKTVLKPLGLWNSRIGPQLLSSENAGNVKGLNIPENIKKLFASCWDRDFSKLIDAAAKRQIWIDQGQSFNVYYAGNDIKAISNFYKKCWEKGLKSTYYFRNKSASNIKKNEEVKVETVGATCSMEEGCVMCQ